ncbi:unnamed protein product [Diamesa tonsa]
MYRSICVLIQVTVVLKSLFAEELPDFEFDDQLTSATSFKSDYIKKQHQLNSAFAPQTFDYLDEYFVDNDDEKNFDTKEKMLRDIMLKALSVRDLKYKFSEVMPMIRALSKSQRLIFASLISAQINGKNLSFDEVKDMFASKSNNNSSKELLLPIVYDLANLVREGFLRTDTYKEHEKQNRNQFLRRSFNVNAKGFEKRSDTVKETQVQPLMSFMREDTFSVDVDDSPRIKNEKNVPERMEDLIPQPLRLIRSQTTPTAAREQAIPVTLSRKEPPKNLTLTEIEDLAFSSINGTMDEEFSADTNSTEFSPQALIGKGRRKNPYLSKGPHPETCERFTGGICLNVKNYPINDIMGSIRRHRHAMEALLAEYRDKTAELEQLDYLGDPSSELYGSTKRRKDGSTDATSVPGAMCNSIIRYARPQKARSATGEWKFIVNTGEHTQTLRLEKCSQPSEPCHYLTENFESQCSQVYNYHRLLSWDNSRGLHVDIFKVPTCCSCHLSGYKEAFPPFGSPSNSITSISNNRHRDQINDDDAYSSSSSNRNSQYSTLSLDSSDDDDEADETNIAYQFGNGFKRIKPVKSATPPQDSFEIRRNRYQNKRVPSSSASAPQLDSYLSPPANNNEANYPFSNRAPVPRSKASSNSNTLKRKHSDQIVEESDLKISHVTVFPPKAFSERSKPKNTPPMSSTIDKNSVNIRLPNSQTIDLKRVNYNYHPIIDFFEGDEPKRNGIDRKTGKVVSEDNSWKPMVGG